jgi:protein TonB
VHAGGAALALMHWQDEDDSDEAGGAMAVELAALPAAAPVDSPVLPYGPEQEEAKLTPQAAKPVVEEVEKDIPHVDPSPAPEPEVALPKPQPEKKETPTEEAQDAVPESERPQQDRDALATAPPRVEAQPAPAAPPSPVQSASLARAQATWAKSMFRQIERHSRGRYPAELERRGVRGVAVVKFRVDRSGRVVSAQIAKSSGWPVLDEEAVANIWRASPLPVPPGEVEDPFLENFMQMGFGMKPDR